MQKPFNRRGMFVLFAALLAAATVVVELTSGVCAEFFFDPIPTLLLKMLAASVPVTLFIALFILNSLYSKTGDRIAFVCIGISLSVSAAFSFQLLPAMPFCLLGVLALGVGMLGLSPYFAFLASVLLLYRWHSYGAWTDDEDDPLCQIQRERRLSIKKFIRKHTRFGSVNAVHALEAALSDANENGMPGIYCSRG